MSSEKREKKRSEREINKIINERAIVIVYIYTIIVARVEIYTFFYTILEVLAWSIFEAKYVKVVFYMNSGCSSMIKFEQHK